ncbi:hypothetical protein M3D50_11835 [Staphylococcus capitis]|uniref:hypothetical protein n=1 Tax=Staphylococcus capitis TaxID=29388 RepID=UPI0021A4537C|nr:hypothetical protein [Staphylococcus capitis]MCT2015183.1 hypothetical protein [Staphylococcus capitis]
MNAETQFHVSVMDARLKKVKKQRDAYKKQRDELINDIAEVKRKAEAFDEIKEYTLDKIETLTTRQEFSSNSNEFERFGNLLTAFKAVKYKISNLERDSDE